MENFKVLIVEDDDEELELMRKTLEFSRFEVAVEKSVEGLMNLFSERKIDFDLIAIDHRMGGIDGIKAFNKALSQAKISGVRFLLLSYRDLSEQELRELYEKNVVVFKKPMTPYEFVSKVESLFA